MEIQWHSISFVADFERKIAKIQSLLQYYLFPVEENQDLKCYQSKC